MRWQTKLFLERPNGQEPIEIGTLNIENGRQVARLHPNLIVQHNGHNLRLEAADFEVTIRPGFDWKMND